VQVELLSVEVLTEIFQHPHNGQLFPLGDTVITLGLIQCLNVVGYYLLLSVRQYSSNMAEVLYFLQKELAFHQIEL
jgi:hypothetical protein